MACTLYVAGSMHQTDGMYTVRSCARQTLECALHCHKVVKLMEGVWKVSEMCTRALFKSLIVFRRIHIDSYS